MAKPAHPLLSLRASGTVGKAVTFQHSGNQNIARRKPEIPYSLTLPQQYQRWLYQDYCAYWATLTPAQKRVYATLAVGKHMSGFAYFMRTKLADLPDITLWLPLDVIAAGTTPDFSKNANTGTVVGATLIPGHISYALDFNGVANRVQIATSPSLNIITATHKFTFHCWIYPHSFPGSIALFRGFNPRYGYVFQLSEVGKLYMRFQDAAGVWHYPESTLTTTLNQWNFVAVTYDATIGQVVFCLNQQFSSVAETATTNNTGSAFWIGGGGWTYYNGLIDHFHINNRALAQTELLLRSTRQFPP